MRLFFVLLISSYVLYANESITITKSISNFKEFDMQMYRDDSAKLSFEDIRYKKDFKLVSNRVSDGYSKSNLWFKFNIKNETNESLKYIIYFTENMIHYLDCYIINGNGSINHYKRGVGYFVEGSPNNLTNPKINIDFKKDETKSIYIKIYSIYPNIGAFYLFDESGFSSYEKIYDNIYSAYFGGILSLILYNIFLFIFSRNISYLYYVMLLNGYLLWQLTLNNFPPLTTFYTIEDYYLAGIPVNFMIIFIILFTRELLSTKRYLPKIDKILIILTYITIILTLIYIIFGKSTTIYINLVASIAFPLLLYIGFRIYLKGNKIAIFFILAEIPFLITSTIFSLMMQGDIAYNIFTRHSIIIGSGVELILFSLSLGYSIRLLQDEKMAIIDQSNRELEIKVKERTKELQESKNRLKEMTIKDPMTNLYNRRHLVDIGHKIIGEGVLFSMIMLDIDKFKNINDTYGHDIGDEAIILFANTISDNTRDEDLCFRIGGEEFVVLLFEITKDEAYKIADKIREATAKKYIELNDKNISFTTSGGVSTVSKDDKIIDNIIKRVDDALYEAKNSGRDRIVVYNS